MLKTMRCSSLLLGLFLTAGVASANTTGEIETPTIVTEEVSQILGGTTASAGQFPTVVAITAASGICTGTLIDREWILTAAHCVDPKTLQLTSQQQVTDSVRVYFNTTTILTTAGKANVRKAVATYPKPTFNVSSLGSNDIGLIRLATPIDGITPSPVNFEAAMAPIGVTVQMVGFGATSVGTDTNGQPLPMNAGTLYYLNNRTSVSCASLGGGSNTNLLCYSQADDKGKCSGDSGGPSFAMIGGKQTVVGVTSFGDKGCGAFGADTRTDIEKSFMLTTAPIFACDGDDDCEGGLCFKNVCISQPFQGNGVGVDCMTPANCQSNLCLSFGEEKKCSMSCTVGDNSTCPDGFDCLDGGGAGVCWAGSIGEDSGCCDSSGRGGPTALFAIGFLAIVLRRRRK